MTEAARKLDPPRRRLPAAAGSTNSITDTIGDTPLVRLNRLPAERGVKARSWPSSNSSTRSPASRTASAST